MFFMYHTYRNTSHSDVLYNTWNKTNIVSFLKVGSRR